MFPCESAVIGEDTNVSGSIVDPNGLKRAMGSPVLRFNSKTVPPAPGTQTPPDVNAAWNTGCQPPNSPPASGSGFQSLANVHVSTNCPCSQRRALSFQIWLNQLSLPHGNGV